MRHRHLTRELVEGVDELEHPLVRPQVSEVPDQERSIEAETALQGSLGTLREARNPLRDDPHAAPN